MAVTLTANNSFSYAGQAKVASSSDGKNLVAVINGGQIYTSTDSGATWTPRDIARNWNAVASSWDGSKLVAAVNNGFIYLSTNSGANWAAIDSNNRAWNSVAISADGSKIFGTDNGSYIRRTTDNGVNWRLSGTPDNWNSIATSFDGMKVVATAQLGQIYTSTDGGANWTARDSNRNWQCVASSADGSKLVAVVYGGQIYTSTNSGVSWTARDSARNWVSVASSLSGSILIAGVSGGQVYISVDSGVNWIAAESSRSWSSFALSNDGLKIVASVHANRIYTGTINLSLSWTARDSARNWQSVASSSDGTNLAAAVYNGQIYTSTDSGATWTARDSNRGWYSVASSSDGTKLVAVVMGGQIYTSTNSGVNWTARDSNRDWRYVTSSPDGTKLAAYTYDSGMGQIYISTNSGVNWSVLTGAGMRNWSGLAISSNGTKLVATETNGRIYTSTDSGANWYSRDSNRGWKGVASSSDGTKLVAVAYGGKIYTSTDSGAYWTARDSNRYWYSVASSSDGTKLVAVVANGQIYTSTDSGVTWIAQESNRLWYSVASSSDGNNLVAVAYGGQIYTGGLVLYTNPGAPTAVSAVAGNKSATVTFTAPTSTGGAAITSYTVTSTPGNITGTGAASPITVSGLTAGTSYTFTVTATNGATPPLTSVASSASAAVTPFDVPSAPATPTTVSGDTNITVSWVAPANGGSAITGYKLRYSSNGGSTWGTADSVGNVLTYNVTGLTDNTNYQFQVLATNAAGDGAYSTATANVQTVTTPSAPQNVALSTPQKNVIKVDWTAPSNNGGSAITGYTIRYRVQGSGASLTEIDNIDPQNSLTTKTYTITGLTGGSLYDVYVYAFNAVDAAKQGAAAYASATPYDVPGAPQSVSAAGGNGYVEINFNDADDNGSPILDYIISVEGMSDVTGTVSPISFSGLTNGQQYTFYIKANNVAGDGPPATITAIPINPTATTIDTSALVVANVAQAAQVVESMSAASATVIEQVAAATISQVKANSTVSGVLTAAKNINAAVASAPVRQAVAKAAGTAAVSTTVSTAVSVSAKVTEYKERIAEVKTATVADSSLQTLVQNTVQGAAKAILSTSESDEIKIASVLIAGNTETGANRVAVKNAAVAAVEEEKSATSIPIAGDALTALKATFVATAPELASVTTMNVLVADKTAKSVMLPIRGSSWYTPMESGVTYTFGNALGSETATFVFDASTNTMTKDGAAFTAGMSFTLNGVDYSSYALGSLSGSGGSLQHKLIEVNLNVEISANGTLEVLGYQPTAPSNIVIASTLLPVDALYDSSNNIALIEFWEPDDRDDIMAQLASTQTLGGVEGYRITAKKLALGLQNCLIGSLDAKSAEPFNAAPKYGATGVQNGNRVMTGFGRFALMAYAHYIMGHVQATAAITNDTGFMRGMLSLNSDTLTDYKYANIGNYDGAAAPWTTAGDASDANLAVRLVKTLIDNNPTTSLVSNGAATTVANIVKQVIGQDASRATDEDNNKYSPENHGLLRFYPDDVIYVSINLTTPTVTVGTGQQVSGPTMEGLYTDATGDKKYTIKLTLGPKV